MKNEEKKKGFFCCWFGKKKSVKHNSCCSIEIEEIEEGTKVTPEMEDSQKITKNSCCC